MSYPRPGNLPNIQFAPFSFSKKKKKDLHNVHERLKVLQSLLSMKSFQHIFLEGYETPVNSHSNWLNGYIKLLM